jgi:hypothetical protein
MNHATATELTEPTRVAMLALRNRSIGLEPCAPADGRSFQ